MSQPNEAKAEAQAEIDEAFNQAAAETGTMLAAVTFKLWGTFGEILPAVAYNAMGNMVETVFEATPFVNPNDMLEEFDNWVKYTRERLADHAKARLS